jgi:hypothetical protein
MNTLTYETPRGTLRVVRGEWINNGRDVTVFKTEDNRYLELVGKDAVVTIVRTRNGGLTTRKLGYLA